MDEKKENEWQNFFGDNAKYIVSIAAGIMLVLLWCFIMFCGQGDNGAAVSEISRNNEQAGNNITAAGAKLENVERGISAAETGIGNVQSTIKSSQERIDHIQDINNRSAELIRESISLSRESRSILESLRKTDKTTD